MEQKKRIEALGPLHPDYSHRNRNLEFRTTWFHHHQPQSDADPFGSSFPVRARWNIRNLGIRAALLLMACGGSPPAHTVAIGALCALSEECVEGAICGQLLFRTIGEIPTACGCEIKTVPDANCCLRPCPRGICR